MKGGLPSGPLQNMRPIGPLASMGLGPPQNFGERPPLAPLPQNFADRSSVPPLNFGDRSMGPPGGPPGGGQQQLPPAPAGMQYIPCIVPMNQDGGAQLPPGAVPVGQVTAAQLQSGALPLGNMPGAFGQPPRPFGPGGPAGPGPPLQDQRPPMQPPRPSRGRSPAGRNNRQGPMPQQPEQRPQANNQGPTLFAQQKERDWNTVRERASPPRQAPRPSLPAQAVQPGPRPPSGPNSNTYGAMQGMAPPNSMAGMGGPGMPGMMPGMQGMPQMPGGSPMNGNQFGPGFPGPGKGYPPQQAEGENMFSALSQNTKEPWRPTYKERRSLSPPRRAGSLPRAGSVGRGGSPDRNTYGPPRRAGSVGRAGSVDRRTSQERRTSLERKRSLERRRGGSLERRKIGTFDRNFVPQVSEWWTQPLTDGRHAQVYLIADFQGLQNAAWRLNNLSDESTSAVDCQGVDLSAASGKLCIMEVAVRDSQGTHCYIFDIMQLGESIQLLAPFLTNPGSSKIFNDAQKHSTVLAHKFGIMLQGVIDAQCAVEMLENKTICNLWEFVEWCNVGPPYLKDEAQRWDRSSEVWAHRPLPKAAISYLVTGACALQAGSPVLWQRLVQQMGNSGPAMVANWSQYRVHMAASAGWACRQAGLWTGDTDFPEVNSQMAGNAPDKPDPEMDDWLAKRFGDGKKGSSQREPSAIRKLPLQVAATVMREGDSPRTASWRAAVAQLGIQRQERQRSASPDLEVWLARRSALLGGDPEQKQSRRASSLPPVRSSAREKQVSLSESAQASTATHEGPFGFGLQIPAFSELEPDRRDWAEILEDEQAKEAEEEGDLFKQMEEERQRLAQQG